MPQTHQDRKPDAAAPKQADLIQRSAKKDLAGMDFASQEAALTPEGSVQMRAAPGAQRGGDVQAAAAEGVQGGGQAMPHLDKIQASFGNHDVGNVQAHVGGEAKEASESIGAEAYATGNNVAFKQAPDVFTAAHEAAHVVQQQAGVQLSGGVGKAGDAYEQNADAVAAKVVAGESAESLLGAPAAASKEGAGAGVQKEEATTPAPAELTPAKASAAVTFNKGKALPPATWAKVAAIVGSSSTVMDATLAKAIAKWQAKMGLAADGKCGDITMGWLAQEPGGVGLENNVKSDKILYLGMNPSSKDLEHSKLTGQGADVVAAKGDRKQGNAKVDGQDTDLGTDAGVQKFVGSLLGGIDKGRRDMLATFLKNADFAAKDELAQLAKALNDAEAGRTIFTRAVLSGHSGGWSFWGDDNGYIPFDELAVVHKIFPKATGCVQDLMMSACNTGQGQKLDQYRAIFPNVKSIWAYVGYSPSAATGALAHMGSWEQATRGPLNEGKINAARDKMATSAGGAKGKNVATEVKRDDGSKSYKTSSPEAMQSFETLKALVDSGMPLYTAAYDKGIIDKQGLSVFYTNLQNLLGNFADRLPDAAKYEKIMKQTLYLRYWENVCKKFMEAYGTKVKAGYGTAAVPGYATGSRDKVLSWISAYPKQGDEGHKLLVQYLSALDPDVLPVTWA